MHLCGEDLDSFLFVSFCQFQFNASPSFCALKNVLPMLILIIQRNCKESFAIREVRANSKEKEKKSDIQDRLGHRLLKGGLWIPKGSTERV